MAAADDVAAADENVDIQNGSLSKFMSTVGSPPGSFYSLFFVHKISCQLSVFVDEADH